MIFIIFILLPLSEGLLSFSTLGTVLSPKGITHNVNCSSTSASHWKWVFNNEVLVDSASCVLMNSSTKYALESQPNMCNLIIKGVTFKDAGTYTCSDTANPAVSEQASMHLVVLDSLVCSQDTRSPLVVFNSTLTIRCSIAYNASNVVNHPRLEWLNNLPDTAQSQTQSNQTFYVTIQNTLDLASLTDKNIVMLEPFVCKMSLGNVIIPEEIKDTCSTPMLSISYPPNDVMILTPRNNSYVATGENIVCLSKANPTGTYTWVFVEGENGLVETEEWLTSVKNEDPNAKPYVGKIIGNSQSIVVNESGTYGCLLSSIYANKVYNAFAFVSIINDNDASRTSLVLLTIVATIIVLLLIYCICFCIFTDFVSAIFV